MFETSDHLNDKPCQQHFTSATLWFLTVGILQLIKSRGPILQCDIIKKLGPFVLSKLWILLADWSMRWSRDTFLKKLRLYLLLCGKNNQKYKSVTSSKTLELKIFYVSKYWYEHWRWTCDVMTIYKYYYLPISYLGSEYTVFPHIVSALE